jgi:hypothetical protein
MSLFSNICRIASCALVAGLLTLSPVAFTAVQADVIPVPNFSFETPAVPLADGGMENIEGWEGNVHGRLMNTSGYSWTPLSGGDGSQMAYLYAPANAAAHLATVYPAMSATYEAGKSYQLTASIGRLDLVPGGSSNTVKMMLFSGEQAAASKTVTFAETSTSAFTDFSVETGQLTPSNPIVGQTITVEFWVDANPTAAQWLFDNVRLTSMTVPEPCAMILLAMGLFGLLCYAWRKRK